ncbi:hypothetical protein HHK36_023990 [Tetracentron sinense]|uniref:Inner centromere protein ARK-binding domain-containing protein n=1 Tax=Tetracentron sinense TaxID=13715 RepID=A0A835D6C8_TETSI|nr:hypothetical protein HHK36_023990 [Tetracentron sinense]
MSTLEKLFVQIFERKKRIIDQVKQQEDLQQQHLASKLLINGIQPPSWLWNPGFENGSEDFKELKKEELISGLIFPPPRPAIPFSSGHCTHYNKPDVTANNGELSDGLFMETCASNKCLDAGDILTDVPKCHLNEIEPAQGCTLNGVVDLDPTATSPQDQTDARISDKYFEPCQSLARIQRSRSRQKALEVRHSVRTKFKMHQSNENTTSVCSGRVTRSRFTFQQPNLVKELWELNNSSEIANESHVGVSQEETIGGLNKENGDRVESGKITSPRISCQQPNCVKEFLELESSFDVVNDDGGLVVPSSSASRNPWSIEKSLQPTQPSSWVEEDAEFQKAQGTEATIRKSRLRQNDLELCDWLETNTEDNPNEGDITDECIYRNTRPQTTHQQLNCVNGLLNPDNSEILSCRVTQSRPALTKDFSPLTNFSNVVEGHDHQTASGNQINILPCNDVNDIVDQERCTAAVVETALVSNGPSEACSVRSGSNMVGAGVREGLEFLVSRLPSDSSTFVEPKKLIFDDVEECRLNEAFSPAMEREKWYSSSEMKSFNSLEPTEAWKKVTASIDHREKNDSLEDLQLLQKEEVMSEKEEAWRASSEDEGNERPELTEREKSKLYSNPTSSSVRTSNWCAVSSRQGTSEIFDDVGADTSPVSNNISKQAPSLINHLTTLQDGKKSSIGSQLKQILDFNLPVVDVDTQRHNFGEKCSAELDVGSGKLYSEDCRHESGAFDGPKELRNHEFNKVTGSSIFKEPSILLGAQETEFSSVVSADSNSVAFAKQKVTAETAQICNAERDAPYFLRSSTSHAKSVDCSTLRYSGTAKKAVQPEKTFNNAFENSWPQYKRRKIEGRPTNVFTASPRLMVKPLQNILEDNMLEDLKTIEDSSEAVLEFQHFPVTCEVEVSQTYVIESPDVEMHSSRKRHKIEGSESSPKLEVKQDELNLKGKDQDANIPFTFKHTQVEASLVPILNEDADRDSQGYLKEEAGMTSSTGISLDGEMQCVADDNRDFLCLESKLSEGTMQEGNSYLGKHGLFSYCSVMSQHNQDLELVGAGQSVPEFEKFSIGVPTEKACTSVAVDGISFDKSDLPSTKIERVSVLEQLCKPTSMLTPSPNFLTKYKLHTVPDMFECLPNGLLEHMNLRKTLPLNDDDSEHLKDIYNCTSEEVGCTFLGSSYSDCLPSSSVQLGCHVRRPPYTPPVGKLCQRITSKSTVGSSEKQECMNPELTCFRIEENPSTSEENSNIDEVADQFQEGISAREVIRLPNREPLVDITREYTNPPLLVSAAETFLDRGSLDSVNMEMNFPGTEISVEQKFENGYGSDRRYMDKENQSSLCGNGVRKATELLHKRFSKPKLSAKTSERKGGQSFSEKDSRSNNIVSNISSFIPFVQQKQQAAAVLTGKRDIKVKALEAADAAKRLEVKRENERKMKKEAAKIERARLEQENMRLLELKQKKKEEERKKKEADLATKKRLREEEDRKEKERKRKCIEETRRQQKEHTEKLRAEKEEKELQRRAADERKRKRKELTDEARKRQQTEKGRGGADSRKMTKVSNIREDCEAFRELDDVEKIVNHSDKTNKDGNLFTERNRDQSYEISPYQGSDDEEEEDDIPNRKFIPSWASKHYVEPTIHSLLKIDPDEIFPLASFYSVDKGGRDEEAVACGSGL